MKTKLETLQNALKRQRRILLFYENKARTVVPGIGLALFVPCVVGILVASPKPLSVTALMPAIAFGGLSIVVFSKVIIWLGRKLAREQITVLENSIQTLEREQ